jgi:hypothetical protein
MTAPAETTVRYRLLCRPELGATLGNTVHVGLKVEYEDELAPLRFEGLPRRIEEIREVIEDVPLFQGRRLDTRLRVSASELRDVMRSPRMAAHEPVLLVGGEVFGRTVPIDRTFKTVAWLADRWAELLAVELDMRWEHDLRADGSRAGSIDYWMQAWKAWRAKHSLDELVREIALHLPAALATRASGKTAGLVQWPRDADRVEDLARMTAEAFEADSDPQTLFEDLKRRLAPP